MLLTIIVLSVLLIVSLVLNWSLFQAGQTQLAKAELYERWILEFSEDVLSTYQNIKEIDKKQMFEKDDEVGSIFQQILELIERLNIRTQGMDDSLIENDVVEEKEEVR